MQNCQLRHDVEAFNVQTRGKKNILGPTRAAIKYMLPPEILHSHEHFVQLFVTRICLLVIVMIIW